MASNLAPLVNLVQVYVGFLFIIPPGFAIVGSNSYGDCGHVETVNQLQAECCCADAWRFKEHLCWIFMLMG